MASGTSTPGPSPAHFPAFYCITYPGIVKNEAKAIRNLGGLLRIKCDLKDNRPLELKPEPGNPYHRSSWSAKATEKDNSFQLLIKCKRRRRKVKTDGEKPSVSYQDETVSAEVLGLLESHQVFKGFADFQYLPIRTVDNATGEKLPIPVDMTDEAFPASLTDALDWLDPNSSAPETKDEDVLDLLAPPLVFGRSSVPSAYVMVREVAHRDEEIKAKQASGAGSSCRKERRSLSLYLQGTEPLFPSAPVPGATAYADDRVQNRQVHEKMEELYSERAAWTRNALAFHTGLADVVLRTLLGKFAFYISSGPWGRLWCRYGYDPRKDPSAVRYQTVMVSFKNHDMIRARNRLRLGPQGTLITGHSTTHKPAEMARSSWLYESGEMPTFRQSFFCLCDIHLPVAQDFLTPSQAALTMGTAHPTLGFLPKGAIEDIRTAIIEDTKGTGERMRAERGEGAEEEGSLDFPELHVGHSLHGDALDDSLDSNLPTLSSQESLTN